MKRAKVNELKSASKRISTRATGVVKYHRLLQWMEPCWAATTPQVHHGGSSCIHRGERLPTSSPLYQTLWSGNIQLLMNWTEAAPLVSDCVDWSEEENSRVSTEGGGSSCDPSAVRARVCVWVQHGPDWTTTTQHSTQLRWRACRPQWTGVNTNSVGTNAYQIRGNRTEQEEGEGKGGGALFSFRAP